MSNVRIIGLCGRKQSGKTTAAETICARFPQSQHDSFAAPLRDCVAAILGYTLEELNDKKEEPVKWLSGVTPRTMMQTLGTEWGRSMIHNQLWVRSLQRRVENAVGYVVISDVRFTNEAAAIRAVGGIVVEIVRDGVVTTDTHVSEQPLSRQLIDASVMNNDTIFRFRDSIWQLCDDVETGKLIPRNTYKLY